MTISREIISELQLELISKKTQRDALLNQLTLIDVNIDKEDNLISKIDSDALRIINIINEKIPPIKQAYDARISSGCRSDLAWVLVDAWEPPSYTLFGGSINRYYKYEVKKNSNTYSFTPYRGLKYYQKPLNRDYGSNIITTFSGSTSVGSTAIAILDNNSQLTQNIQPDDIIVDSISNPTIFSPTNLPKFVGFGTINAVGIVTTLGGGISTGSTIFAHYGPGISTIGVNTGMSFECVGIITTTIVGFGTTTFPVTFLNGTGEYETTEVPCNSLILNDAAPIGTIENIFTVGIITTYSAAFISTVSLASTTNNTFTVLRIGDIDTNFDYLQNPLEPLNIGVINSSTVGIGHSIFLDISGNSSQTQTWSPSSSYFDSSTNTQINPEPLVGGGKVEYYIGTLLWPSIIKCSGAFPSISCTSTIAPEGTVAITSSSNPISLGTTSRFPGIDPTGTLCNQLQQNIDNAIEDLNNVIAQYQSQIEPIINATKTLRRDRDRKELQAWSILQALGSITEEIKRLESDISTLDNIDFSPYESN
jgi:hypothetical protein